MDEVIERLARGCAEAIITVQPAEPHEGGWWVCIGRSVTKCAHAHLYGKADAEYDAANYRDNAAPFIADALRGFAMIPPWPSPVSGAGLAEIMAREAEVRALDKSTSAADADQWYAALADRTDLITHVLHLTRLVQAMSSESEGLIFASGVDVGKRLGAREQRAADVKAADELGVRVGAAWMDGSASGGVLKMVQDYFSGLKAAPLVTDPPAPPSRGGKD